MAALGALPLFHRIAGERVVVVGDGAMAEAKRRLVERAGGLPCSEAEAHHARLAFVAHEDEREARAAQRRLKAAGLLVNVADRPDLCDFITPSILERDPLLVAISTGGASAGLAKHVRLRLERLLPPHIGALARRLHAARAAMRARWPDADGRRRALDAALEEGGMLDPFEAGSSEKVDGWLAERDPSRSAMEPVHIRLRSDDPDDLTLREARALGRADRVLHGEGVPTTILDRARADAERGLWTGETGDCEGLVVIVTRADARG